MIEEQSDQPVIPGGETQSDDIQPVTKRNRMLNELKHSVQLHVTLMNGPSQQLAAFLLKVIDFVEDHDEKRRDSEIGKLAYIIVESLAVFVQRSIDDRAQKAEAQDIKFPPRIKQAGDNLLVVIGKSRSHDDKIGAKNVVLRAIADALRELATFTKADYPTITDSQRREL